MATIPYNVSYTSGSISYPSASMSTTPSAMAAYITPVSNNTDFLSTWTCLSGTVFVTGSNATLATQNVWSNATGISTSVYATTGSCIHFKACHHTANAVRRRWTLTDGQSTWTFYGNGFLHYPVRNAVHTFQAQHNSVYASPNQGAILGASMLMTVYNILDQV